MKETRESLWEIFRLFLGFGWMAWGGPVAQIAMLQQELVEKRRWVTRQNFPKVLAVYQALPGPEAFELCVYFGMVRAGRLGGLLAGLGFMLPGFVLMLGLVYAYLVFGAAVLLPFFVGVAPAVVALMTRATVHLGRHTLPNFSLRLAGLAAFALSLLQVHFLLVFLLCAVWQALWAKQQYLSAWIAAGLLLMMALSVHFSLPSEAPVPGMHGAWPELPLFLEGLRAGLLSFGGAYTVIPFLKESMVGVYPLITQASFLDGIALASMIPAPLVIFGTYLGFLAHGLEGALLVTAGIFLPAFAITLLGHTQLEKLIARPGLHGALDGIAAAVVGLLALTTLQVAAQVITTGWQLGFFAGALALLYLLKGPWKIPIVILASGVLGWVL